MATRGLLQSPPDGMDFVLSPGLTVSFVSTFLFHGRMAADSWPELRVQMKFLPPKFNLFAFKAHRKIGCSLLLECEGERY